MANNMRFSERTGQQPLRQPVTLLPRRLPVRFPTPIASPAKIQGGARNFRRHHRIERALVLHKLVVARLIVNRGQKPLDYIRQNLIRKEIRGFFVFGSIVVVVEHASNVARADVPHAWHFVRRRNGNERTLTRAWNRLGGVWSYLVHFLQVLSWENV